PAASRSARPRPARWRSGPALAPRPGEHGTVDPGLQSRDPAAGCQSLRGPSLLSRVEDEDGGSLSEGNDAYHNRTVQSSPAEARVLPSGLKATSYTQPSCPLRVARDAPVAASH